MPQGGTTAMLPPLALCIQFIYFVYFAVVAFAFVFLSSRNFLCFVRMFSSYRVFFFLWGLMCSKQNWKIQYTDPISSLFFVFLLLAACISCYYMVLVFLQCRTTDKKQQILYRPDFLVREGALYDNLKITTPKSLIFHWIPAWIYYLPVSAKIRYTWSRWCQKSPHPQTKFKSDIRTSICQ